MSAGHLTKHVRLENYVVHKVWHCNISNSRLSAGQPTFKLRLSARQLACKNLCTCSYFKFCYILHYIHETNCFFICDNTCRQRLFRMQHQCEKKTVNRFLVSMSDEKRKEYFRQKKREEQSQDEFRS